MRVSLGIAAALLLGASQLHLPRAQAREPQQGSTMTWLVLTHLPTAGDAERDTDNRLQARLNEFVDRVRAAQSSNLPRQPSLRVERRAEDLDRLANGHWNPNWIALIWGDVTSDQQQVTAVAWVDIGRSRVISLLSTRSNRFHPARAYVSRVHIGDERSELGIYEAIVGYALLIRAWETQPAMVPPIAATLSGTIAAASRQPRTGSSLCLRAIRDGMEEIRRKAAEGRRPNAGASAPPTENLANCVSRR